MSEPIFIPDDLTKLTDVRLGILFGRLLVAIKREIKANPKLHRLCNQSDRVEDEIARRDFERNKDQAP